MDIIIIIVITKYKAQNESQWWVFLFLGTADMGVYVCHPYGEGESRETTVLKGFKTRHLDHSSAAAMAVVWRTFSTGTTLANDFFHFVDGTCSLACTHKRHEVFSL